ncbi:MAG: hypothetical protein IPN18_18465 [Ignavibacteriales bacterium]|nr:hypothetical protein [Ignavibacteriales bacterium]
MNKKLYLIIIMLLIAGTFDLTAQTEHERYGCKYVKSKMKLRGFTEAELKYAEDLEFRSDTFDIINYRINVDVTDFSGKKIQAGAILIFLQGCQI